MLLFLLLFFLSTIQTTTSVSTKVVSIGESTRWCLSATLESRKYFLSTARDFMPTHLYVLQERLNLPYYTPHAHWNAFLREWAEEERLFLSFHFSKYFWMILEGQIEEFSDGILKWVPPSIKDTIIPKFCALVVPTELNSYYRGRKEAMLYKPHDYDDRTATSLFSDNHDAFLAAHYYSLFENAMLKYLHLFPLKLQEWHQSQVCGLEGKIAMLEECWEEFWVVDHCKTALLLHTLANYLSFLRHLSALPPAHNTLYEKVKCLWYDFSIFLRSICTRTTRSVKFLFEIPLEHHLHLVKDAVGKDEMSFVQKCIVYGVPWDNSCFFGMQTNFQVVEGINSKNIQVFVSMHRDLNPAQVKTMLLNYMDSKMIKK